MNKNHIVEFTIPARRVIRSVELASSEEEALGLALDQWRDGDLILLSDRFEVDEQAEPVAKGVTPMDTLQDLPKSEMIAYLRRQSDAIEAAYLLRHADDLEQQARQMRAEALALARMATREFE